MRMCFMILYHIIDSVEMGRSILMCSTNAYLQPICSQKRYNHMAETYCLGRLFTTSSTRVTGEPIGQMPRSISSSRWMASSTTT